MQLTATKAPLALVLADLMRDDFNFLDREIIYSAENPGFLSKDSYCKISQIIDGTVIYWDSKSEGEWPVQFDTIDLVVFADRNMTEELTSFTVPVDLLRNCFDGKLTGLRILRMIEAHLGGLSGFLPKTQPAILQPA